MYIINDVSKASSPVKCKLVSEVCIICLTHVNINAKISDDLVHKLLYKCYRIWPLVLWPCPEDFEKLAYSEEFS